MKSLTQPYCRYCSRPIKKRTRTVFLRVPDPNAKYANTDSEFWRTVEVEKLPQTREECQKLTNRKVVSIRRWQDGIHSFTDWDGESYDDEFFCTTTCAQGLGYAAAREGWATKRWKTKIAS